jgi:hypothetical protein
MASERSLMITYENVIEEMLLRLPELREADEFGLLAFDPPIPYSVFESLLRSSLEDALVRGNLARIVRTTAFLEEVSEAAVRDAGLANLLGVAIGEWLGYVQYEDKLAPWLGPETKRITGYVPGLATQRRADALAKQNKRLSSRLKRIAKQLINRNT